MNNLSLQISRPARCWPAEIFVEPARLASRIWGYPDGDILAAYSADTFPKVKSFIHECQHFANLGFAFGHRESCNAYPLIPEEQYSGPEPRQYSYEGRLCSFRGRKFRLGPCVQFICRERSTEEWTELMRRQYAYGGYFAAGKTYAQVLEYFHSRPNCSDNELRAIASELAWPDSPLSQSSMVERIGWSMERDSSNTQLEMPL